MRRTIILAALLVSFLTDMSAQKREKYEFMRNLPVYADSLIADLTFPLAWGRSDIKDFDEWRKAARQKVFDCMLTPPPPAGDYSVKVLAEEQRDGYKARKIEIRLSRYYTVPALVLIPDGKGPFPAVNCLHDHGAHLYIGKEKMIRPIVTNDSTGNPKKEDLEVLADADKWVADLYEGPYLGDYLAKNGFVVFSADAPMWGDRGQKEGPRRDRYDMIAGNMMMYGINLSAYMTYDDIAGTRFLATMPEVDPKRIGCVGNIVHKNFHRGTIECETNVYLRVVLYLAVNGLHSSSCALRVICDGHCIVSLIKADKDPAFLVSISKGYSAPGHAREFYLEVDAALRNSNVLAKCGVGLFAFCAYKSFVFNLCSTLQCKINTAKCYDIRGFCCGRICH